MSVILMHAPSCESAVFAARLTKQSQPRETLEQHLVAYLTQKFGLRPLVREWRHNIIAATDKYRKSDATIALFGKILRCGPF